MGHRNEPARTRHREQLKRQLNLYSIPLAEPRDQQYSLDNHFGWKVLQKCKIGEGSFPPHLLHCMYCDKPPDMQGGDYDKVSYVLYVRGKDGTLEPVEVKETQTFSTETFVRPVEGAIPLEFKEKAPPPRKKSANRERSISRERKRLISDFYYVPIRGRSVDKYGGRPASSGGDMIEKKPVEGGKSPKKERGRTVPKGWQLRAGADSDEVYKESTCLMDIGDNASITSGSEIEDEVEETSNNQMSYAKKFDCSNCFGRSPTNAELMESPMERNRYLYMPRERYEKRPLKMNDVINDDTKQ